MIRDIGLVVVLLFAIALSLVIINLTYGELNQAIQDAPEFSASSKAIIADSSSSFSTVWDFTYFTAVFAVVLGAIILAWVVRANPGLFFAVILVIMVLGAVAGYLANAFDDIILDAALGASAANFPVMSWINSHYLIIVIGTAFLMITVFYSKPTSEGYI